MHRHGSPSWRFEVGGATALSVALRCRDRLGVPVPESADVPPADTGVLAPGAPDADVVGYWLAWWRALLDRTGAWMSPVPLTGEVRRDRRPVTVPDALDLIDHAPLRRLATDAAEGHVEASHRSSPPLRGDFRPPVPSSVVQDAVFDTAGRHQVPIDDLWGGVHLVPGPVGWRAVVRPGYGLMVIDDAATDGDLYRFVCDVLASGLRGPAS